MNKGPNEKISRALKGNSNAEKYSEKEAVKLFNDSIDLSLKMSEGEYKFDFIGEVARELKTYHQVYAHLAVRFPQLDAMYTELKANLETNCYFNTKKGKIREATGLVNLKSNHHWTDRQQIDTNISGEVDIQPKKWINTDEDEKE